MKILIVEDNPGDLAMIQRQLHSAGFGHLITATTGAEGLQLINEAHPDFLITDTVLPDMEGFEVLKYYKESHATPAIMMTGSLNAMDAERARRAGADDFVVKNTGMSQLVHSLRTLGVS